MLRIGLSIGCLVACAAANAGAPSLDMAFYPPAGLLVAQADAHAEPELIDTRWGTVIGNAVVTLIVFCALIWLLSKTAWKPILHLLNERERTIRESLETAREQREQARKMAEEHQRQLDKAREEASAIVAEGRRDAEAVRQRFREDARKEADQMIARARREIQLATDSARKELHDEASDLAVRVAAAILRKELAPADHRDLVDQSLREMKSSDQGRLN